MRASVGCVPGPVSKKLPTRLNWAPVDEHIVVGGHHMVGKLCHELLFEVTKLTLIVTGLLILGDSRFPKESSLRGGDFLSVQLVQRDTGQILNIYLCLCALCWNGESYWLLLRILP